MAIYYCSWATGDDTTGDGSAGTPWKTIDKATTSRSAGDEIRVEKSADPTALTGTVGFTVNSTAVTGSGTAFTTELVIGDFILAPDGQYYEVITLTSDTAAVLYKKYPSATQSGFSSYKLGVTDTGAASGNVQAVNASGNVTTFLYISGGWNLSTETQTGQSYFRQMHSTFNNRYGNGLQLTGKSYVHISRLHFLRYNIGISYSNSSSNTVVSPTCNSNGNQGISYGGGSNNTTISPICNSNNSEGIIYSTSHNNTVISPTCNSNSNQGIYSTGSSNNIMISPVCNSNGYGINYSGGVNNKIFGVLSTAGNATAAIKTNCINTFVAKATIGENTIVDVALSAFQNGRIFFNDVGGYSYIYTDNGNIISQNATAGGTGKEWKFSPTNAIRNSFYPLDLPIARFAVASTGQVTVTCYFKKSATSVAGALRCRYGQVAWSDAASDIVVNCPDDTNRNQVTLQFTPTEAGVVEIEALAWYVSATDQNVIIDDIAISQA